MNRRAFFAIVRSVCLGGTFCITAISHGVAAPAGESLPTITIDAPDAPKPATAPKPKRPSSAQRRPTRPVQPAPAVDSAVAGGRSNGAGLDGQPVAAASEKNFTGEQLNVRPFARVGEVLEAVPGLIVTQHSGEGKANQYFLRGFNLDHGTDLAISVAGMPVNMPTHAHGQGYADINFVIPELIQSLNVRKGPYYADAGDFASAGTLRIDYLNKLPKNILEMTFGSFGYQRALAAGSTALGDGTLLAALEANRFDGPWDVPGNVRKLNGVMRYSQGTATDGFSLTAMGYANSWTSTDQVAQRAIDQGLIGRLGSLDPTDGGQADRFSLSSSFAQSSDIGQMRIESYVVHSSLRLFNNFTYFLTDPVNGDQFSQSDRRTLAGLNASQSINMRLAGMSVETRFGLQTRADDINLGLFRTSARTTISTVRADSVQESNIGLWTDTTARWTDWLRATMGLRQDYFAGRVASDTPANSGDASASMTSPKVGVVLGPWFKTELFGNAGTGLHSNDIRGATITVDPNDKLLPLGRVPLLVRSKGAEVGIRTKALDGLTSSLALFVLDFDSELLFLGDAGTTEATRPSRRMGVEWTNQYKLLPWMQLNADFAYTQARFTNFDPAGDRIPGAPAAVATAGLTFGKENGWFGALTGRYFGPRPLIEDASVHSLSSLVFNARLGYKFDNGFRLQLDALNLFNAQTNQIEYYYVSRLPGEPFAGLADRHVHPVEPLAIRLTLAGRF